LSQGALVDQRWRGIGLYHLAKGTLGFRQLPGLLILEGESERIWRRIHFYQP
jgi:hypothetical protein